VDSSLGGGSSSNSVAFSSTYSSLEIGATSPSATGAWRGMSATSSTAAAAAAPGGESGAYPYPLDGSSRSSTSHLSSYGKPLFVGDDSGAGSGGGGSGAGAGATGSAALEPVASEQMNRGAELLARSRQTRRRLSVTAADISMASAISATSGGGGGGGGYSSLSLVPEL
jgi:hypothetical protein